MRIVFMIFILVGCTHKDAILTIPEKEKSLQGMALYTGDSIVVQIPHDIKLDQLKPVDSLFYFSYMKGDSNFCEFNQEFSNNGGPDCKQFYFGKVMIRNDFTQYLILQEYKFNDVVNSIFLMTIDMEGNRKSVLEIASLIYQAEVAPNYRSIIFQDSIVKFETTRNLIPEDIEENRWLVCRDSLTKKFKFLEGEYTLSQFDSVRLCDWITKNE